jgi:hypothetical protein
MFLIKNSQLETLSAIGREEFIKKMMKLLRNDFEELRSVPVKELHDTISLLIDKAKAYGFSLTSTLASYIVTSFVLGDNFDTEISSAKDILIEETHETQKSKNLEDLVNNILITSENEIQNGNDIHTS